MALVYAIAAYGIHRRAPIVWNLGWVALVICFSVILDFSTVVLAEAATTRLLNCLDRNRRGGSSGHRVLGRMVEAAKGLL